MVAYEELELTKREAAGVASARAKVGGVLEYEKVPAGVVTALGAKASKISNQELRALYAFMASCNNDDTSFPESMAFWKRQPGKNSDAVLKVLTNHIKNSERDAVEVLRFGLTVEGNPNLRWTCVWAAMQMDEYAGKANEKLQMPAELDRGIAQKDVFDSLVKGFELTVKEIRNSEKGSSVNNAACNLINDLITALTKLYGPNVGSSEDLRYVYSGIGGLVEEGRLSSESGARFQSRLERYVTRKAAKEKTAW